MKTIIFLLMCLLATQTSFAETIKERLRRAQMQEEMQEPANPPLLESKNKADVNQKFGTGDQHLTLDDWLGGMQRYLTDLKQFDEFFNNLPEEKQKDFSYIWSTPEYHKTTNGFLAISFAYAQEYQFYKKQNLHGEDSIKLQKIKIIYEEITKIYSTQQSKFEDMTNDSLLKFKISENDGMARAILRKLSIAAESYATSNAGNYPEDIASLIEATPPYLNTNYCGQTTPGYTFECFFDARSYRFMATPVEEGTSGTTIYTISTGGVLTP